MWIWFGKEKKVSKEPPHDEANTNWKKREGETQGFATIQLRGFSGRVLDHFSFPEHLAEDLPGENGKVRR